MKTGYSIQGNTLIYKDKGTECPIRLAEVIFIQSNGHYCLIIVNNKKHIIKRSLTELSMRLENFGFYRVHRKYLVNISKVVDYNNSSNKIYFKNHGPIVVSRARKKGLKEQLQKLK